MPTTIKPTMSATEKNAAASARILALKASGMSTQEAIDAVLGAGTHAALAGLVYDALRAKAAGK